MELEQCVNFALTKAQNIVHQFFKARLAPYGITPGQYGVLKCLWDEDGLTVKKLAERMYLDSSTITGLLDRMENKGLIKRQSSPSDRRALSVVLTPAGKALQEPVTQAIIDANQAVLKNMSEEEADSFLNILLSLNGK
ncbi:MAG: MarR family winged helix-turn-helix transcriptional regulator [Syntrophomonadaceae bacterium]|jgi:DNA-binding MarR family transcriptional regulator|nr:MarR family transcriptional regulator [Bacillota bacterium]NLM89523.1 MarR family transcriptional regulator [Syntrophomonadaceae bacterium]HAA08329.1 MarR family transcriptional regulator [Syntrophomonas sp.]HQA50395.1 MarR family transcriptional regulator [Syntrophomonadaceae bacterium]HQD91317.1 MarR family transcriptional regulator [Syntrophomonadaceae bacterium]